MRQTAGTTVSQNGKAVRDDTEDANADDLADIDKVLAGDRHAFTPLVMRHGPAIAKQMRHYSDDPRAIDELTNDVFVEAYLGLAGFRRLAPFRHWLARIATRTGYKHWKSLDRSRKQIPLDEVAEHAAPEEECTPESAANMVYDLLAELPDDDRLVLTLMYLEDCGHREIAARMGWNPAVVAMRVLRAKRKLRKIGKSEKWRQRLAWIQS